MSEEVNNAKTKKNLEHSESENISLQHSGLSYDERIEMLCEEIRSLREKLQISEGGARVLAANINALHASIFWRITKPARYFVDLSKRVIRKLKRTIKPEKPPKTLAESLGLKEFGTGDLSVYSFISEDILNKQQNYKFKNNIKFSIVVPLFNTDKLFLKHMLQSVMNQTYTNWELCLADASDSKHSYVAKMCKDFAENDSRIRYKKLEKNIDISQNTNRALEMVTGDYVAFLDHDDILHPCALFEDMLAIENHGADFIYTDELSFEGDIDKITVIHLKPDFAIDNLRAINYICHFTCVKKSILDEVGGFDSACNGSQDFDMVLRLTEKAQKIYHIREILYFWRVHPLSAAASVSNKSYCLTSAVNALEKHFKRCNINASVMVSQKLKYGVYDVSYKINGKPLVSIIIPNKDHMGELKRCIDSILFKTIYDNYEIIVVENNSTEEETFEYYKEIERNSRIKIIEYKGEFNYSAINNFAVKEAKGEYLLFLNNDTEVITASWVENMLMHAAREDVAAVGAKLYFPDFTVQHAGVVLGIGGIANHAHLFYDANNFGYMGRAMYIQDFSAVTAACMMIKKDKFLEAEGFDEKNFKVAYNDIDLCLKLRKLGYLNVFTPFAELFHDESKSRGRDDDGESKKRLEAESRSFEEKWGELIKAGDPYYHPYLFSDAAKSFQYDLKPYSF